MAWTLTLKAMRDEAALLAEEVEGEWGDTGTYEQLGRTLRWLDDPGGGRDWLGRAARYAQEHLGVNEPERGENWARVGGLELLAGQDVDARSHLERSLVARHAVGREERAEVLQLLGRHDEVVAAGVEPVATLARAARDGDSSMLPAAREAWLAIARSDRSGPHQISRIAPWTAWDWIEETFLLEARLTGEPAPTHEEMLMRLGVLRAPRAAKPSKAPEASPAPQPGTTRKVRVAAADGKQVVGRAEVEADGSVVCVLDPREDRFLAVALEPLEGAWGAGVLEGPDDEAEWIVEQEYPTPAEAADAAADWLAVNAPEPHDGPQAAAALRTIVAAL